MNGIERVVEVLAATLFRLHREVECELVSAGMIAAAEALADLLDAMVLSAPVHDPETMH